LNLVWRRASLDNVLEGYFIREVLLAGLQRPVRQLMFEDDWGGTIDHDTLFVVLRGDTVDLLRAARVAGLRNLGVLHVGDETGIDGRFFYQYADYVLRHYWFKEIVSPTAAPPVIWVPNGYKAGVGPIDPARTLPFDGRQIPGFFAGSFHPDHLNHERQRLLDIVQREKLPFLMVGTSRFGIGMTPATYGGFLGNSKFALVPGGVSPETIRLYDALEHGTIPIVLESPFIESNEALGALGVPPLVLLDNWSSLPKAFRHLMQIPPSRLEDRRRGILDWWTRFKAHCQARAGGLIEASFSRSQP
jgi:hypothetical protein